MNQDRRAGNAAHVVTVAHVGRGDEQDQQDRRPPVAETLVEPAHKQIAEGGRDIADRDPHGIQAARDAEARRNGDDVQRVEVVRQADDHADREKGSDDNAQIAQLPVSLFHDAFPPQKNIQYFQIPVRFLSCRRPAHLDYSMPRPKMLRKKPVFRPHFQKLKQTVFQTAFSNAPKMKASI